MMKDDPISAAGLYHTALAQQGRGQLDKAIETYRQLLRLKPDFVEAQCNLGGALHAAGDYRQATDCYKKVLAINPNLPQLHFNLGAALQAMDEIEPARASYARAIKLKPDYLEAYFNAGLLEMGQRQFHDALAYFRQALAINPRIAEVQNVIGVCLKELGNRTQAIRHFQQALQLTPNHFEALNNLAVELVASEQLDDAIRCAERAVALRAAEPKALYNLGIALKGRKRFSEAVACFRKALEQDPGALHARLDLAHSLQTMCDWRDAEFSLPVTAALIEQILDRHEPIHVDLFNALSLPVSGETLLRVARCQAMDIERTVAHLKQEPVVFSRDQTQRLRIGYLSPKYRNHAGAHLMGGLFKAHDRASFEIFAYSIGPDDQSRYRRRIEQDAEHFVDLYEASLEDCVERIRADGIQILVDFAGYTTGARPEIFALRAAPLQVNYLGFPGSLGAEWYDYIITDRVVTPPGEQALYSESFAYVHHCYQINDEREQAAQQGPDRATCSLPEGAFVFCCFNNNYKIEPRIFDVWAAILLRVPGSVLWLLQGSPEQADNLRREAVQRGVDPSRLVFAEPLEKSLHLARHHHADLFLDTLYYNAHTTGSDALRMGVPMLTTPGKTFASRVGASLLQAVGLDDMIAETLDDYLSLAVSLASEPLRLRSVRERLAGNLSQSSLFNSTDFARDLERLYQIMWERFASNVKPATIWPARS